MIYRAALYIIILTEGIASATSLYIEMMIYKLDSRSVTTGLGNRAYNLRIHSMSECFEKPYIR
jgi:hypothetical protein